MYRTATVSPLAAFSTGDRQVNLSVTLSQSRFQAQDAEMFKEFTRSKISSLFKDVTIHKQEVTTINNRQAVIFEFTGKSEQAVKGAFKEKYNYVTYYFVDTFVYSATFYCNSNDKKLWENAAQNIMQSVKIKK